MAIELPAKKYYTFLELAERLRCSELDLRHLVIEKEIAPSCYLDSGLYVDFQVEANEDQHGLNLWPSEVMNWETNTPDFSFRTQLAGFHYLIFPRRISATSCEFDYASKNSCEQNAGDICYGLEESFGLDYVLKNGVVMAGELARFEALHSKDNLPAQVDKPLGTRERDGLLTIIAALAKAAKIQIDDYRKPGKAAGYIEGLTEELGARVSKRAIEEHLKKIPDALETRMK